MSRQYVRPPFARESNGISRAWVGTNVSFDDPSARMLLAKPHAKPHTTWAPHAQTQRTKPRTRASRGRNAQANDGACTPLITHSRP